MDRCPEHSELMRSTGRIEATVNRIDESTCRLHERLDDHIDTHLKDKDQRNNKEISGVRFNITTVLSIIAIIISLGIAIASNIK